MQQILTLTTIYIWHPTKQGGKYAGRTLRDSFFVIMQAVVVPPLSFLVSSFLRVHVSRPSTLVVPPGTLILANHQSYLDPFLIAYHLGPTNWPRIMPCRFPVMTEMMQKRLYALPMRALGCYDIGVSPMVRAKKLLFTRELLESGRTIMLFPEGAITKKGEMIGDFKMGAQMLFSRGYPVVFVKLSGFTRTHRSRLFRRGSFSLTYSDVIVGDEVTKVDAMHNFFRAHGTTS